MAAEIVTLTNEKDEPCYPETVTKGVYRENGTTLEDTLNDMLESDSETEFLENGSIKKTLKTGTVITYEFMDNKIIQTETNSKGEKISKKITTFEEGKIITKTEEVE